jgi:hypothetical protein
VEGRKASTLTVENLHLVGLKFKEHLRNIHRSRRSSATSELNIELRIQQRRVFVEEAATTSTVKRSFGRVLSSISLT